jgi:hypothetical protein
VLLEEMGTRQERLSIGLPVWVTAVAMAYVGVPAFVVIPLGIVGLALVASALASSLQGAALVQAAVAAPLVIGHIAVNLPDQPWSLPSFTEEAIASAPRAPLPEEVTQANTTIYGACAYWGAMEAIVSDCPNCLSADASARRAELVSLPDPRRCERIFAQTYAHWRGRTTDCEALAEQHPRLARETQAAGGLCKIVRR